MLNEGKETVGNLLDMAEAGEFDVIVHGCNCFCTMGSGIAKQVRERYPQAYAVDKNTAKGDISKMGRFSYTTIVGENHSFNIINAYTQFRYGLDKQHTDYDAIRNAFKLIKRKFSGLRIGYPMIGAGLGGGDWSVINNITNEELAGEDHTFVRFEK